MGQFAASASGTLVYAAGGIQPPYTKTLLRVRHELASGEKDGLEFDAFRELESMPDPQKH
jgi:hypothetical protein